MAYSQYFLTVEDYVNQDREYVERTIREVAEASVEVKLEVEASADSNDEDYFGEVLADNGYDLGIIIQNAYEVLDRIGKQYASVIQSKDRHIMYEASRRLKMIEFDCDSAQIDVD